MLYIFFLKQHKSKLIKPKLEHLQSQNCIINSRAQIIVNTVHMAQSWIDNSEYLFWQYAELMKFN